MNKLYVLWKRDKRNIVRVFGYYEFENAFITFFGTSGCVKLHKTYNQEFQAKYKIRAMVHKGYGMLGANNSYLQKVRDAVEREILYRKLTDSCSW